MVILLSISIVSDLAAGVNKLLKDAIISV